MKNKTKLPLIMLFAALGYGSSFIAAAETPPDWVWEFPADVACEFPLRIEGWDGKSHINEFKDKNGFVRSLSAGTGSALRFTNLDIPSRTFSTKSNGAVQHTTTYKPDGSFTITATGHNVVILYPTDIPAGPSTTLYVGQVSITSDAAYNYTVTKESGKKTDICAEVN